MRLQGMFSDGDPADSAFVGFATISFFVCGLQQARLERALRRDKQRQKRLLEAGIDYEYKPLEAALAPKPKHKTFNEDE